MMFRNCVFFVLGTATILTGCATSEERCRSQATRDLATIDTLIAETEANLARGFTTEREVSTRSGVSFCAGSYRSSVGVSFCSGDRYVERERAVAIDRETEQRKLNDLKERRAEIEPRTAQAVAACRA